MAGTSTAYNYFTGSKENPKHLKVNDITDSSKETYIEQFKYYIPVGEFTFESIDTITIGNTTFKSNETSSLSIGNYAFITDKVFIVDNNMLYIATPILLLELIENNSFKVNGDTYSLGLSDSVISEASLSQVEWESGSLNVVTEQEDGRYLLTLKDKNAIKWLKFKFSETPSSYLTKKTYTTVNNEKIVGYGYTAAEDDGSLAFYPQPYGSKGITYKTIEYSVYFNDKAKHIKLDFKTE